MRDVGEAQGLSEDVLIHVTGLFRDRETFEALETRVFPALVDKRPDDTPIRAWVPGCSTGDEVYSLVIVLVEVFTERVGKAVPILVFGTDIRAHAVDRARAGEYTGDLEKQVSPARLRRFFVKIDGGYRI